MSWQTTVFLIVFLALVHSACESCGVYRRVNDFLNPPVPAAPSSVSSIDETKFAELKNEVDRVKLALNFKEFKK